MPNSTNIVFELPPHAEPSEALLSNIKRYKAEGKPLKFLARMRRVPAGFIFFLDKEYIQKALPN